MSKIYKIPSEFKVGFQCGIEGEGTGIGFLVYEKESGELSSPTAFENWRNKDIPIKTFGNSPTSGHKIVKFVGGDSYSHSRLSQVRIEDPRGFQMEIKIDNFSDILKNDVCDKLVLQGKYIYAWDNQRIVLISPNSEEYKNSIKFTEQSQYDPRDCVPGEYYEQKGGVPMLFLGQLWCNGYKKVTAGRNYKYFEDRKHYLNIKTKFVFKVTNKWNDEPLYVTFSSGKITNKLVKCDIPRINNTQIDDAVKDFYVYDHGTPSPIAPTKYFRNFFIPERFKITDPSQVPPINTYKHIYWVLDDPKTIICLGYRMTGEIFAPTSTSTIEMDEQGINYINTAHYDTRQQSDKHLNLHRLIEEGKLYVIPNKNRLYGDGLMIESDHQKITLNVF